MDTAEDSIRNRRGQSSERGQIEERNHASIGNEFLPSAIGPRPLTYFAYRFLTTSPPFITNLTRSRVVTSPSGSPSTATMSAHFPGAIVPTLSDQPKRSASLMVAA